MYCVPCALGNVRVRLKNLMFIINLAKTFLRDHYNVAMHKGVGQLYRYGNYQPHSQVGGPNLTFRASSSHSPQHIGCVHKKSSCG
jgi:hypothetical protein